MVNLTTESPTVQQQDLNILLGSFQNRERSFLEAAGDAALTGTRTFQTASRNLAESMGIDEQLAAELLDSAAGQELSSALRKGSLRAAQNGSQDNAIDLTAQAAISRARARGVPMEQINMTVRDTAGKSPRQVILDELASQEQEEPTKPLIDFLEREGELFTEDGTSIHTLAASNPEALEDFAREKFNERDRLADSQRKVDRMVADDRIALNSVVNELRTELIPAQVSLISSRINSFLYENGLITQNVGEDGVAFTRGLDISNIPTDDVELMKRELRNLRDAAEAQVRSKLQLRPGSTEAQVQQAMEFLNVYMREAELVLSGESTLETLETVEAISQSRAVQNFHRNNPLARDSITAVTLLSRPLQNLGFEGFETKEQIASLLIPAVERTTASLAGGLVSAGLDEKQQKKVFQALSNQAVNAANDPVVRADALGKLIPNMAKGAATNPDLYDALLDVFADPAASQVFLSQLSSEEQVEYRDDVVTGFANYLESFKRTVESDFQTMLTRPILPGQTLPPPGFNATVEERDAFFQSIGEVEPRSLSNFVNDNLFIASGQEFNIEAISSLSERERKIFAAKFKEMRNSVLPRIEKIRAITENFDMLRDSFDVTPEPTLEVEE